MSEIRMKTSLNQGTFLLKSLDDFDMPGFALADDAFYSKADKRAQLIRFFCGKAEMQLVGDALLEALEEIDGQKMDEDEIHALMEKLGNELDGIAGGRYFGSGSHADYTKRAMQAVQGIDEKHRPAAYAHVLLYCWIFRRQFDAFSSGEQQALLARWSAQEPVPGRVLAVWLEDIDVSDGKQRFMLDWKDVGDAPLTVRRLVNSGDGMACFTLDTPLGSRTVRLPAGGRLNAYFAGEHLVCIKGQIQARGGVALCRGRNQTLQRLDAHKKSITMMDVETPEDFAVGQYERLYLLRDGVLTVPKGMKRQDVIGIFSAGDVWVAWKKDAGTESNDPQYRARDVLSVVETPKGLRLIRRGAPGEHTQEMTCMLARFDTGKEHIAERVFCEGFTAELNENGELQRGD